MSFAEMFNENAQNMVWYAQRLKFIVAMAIIKSSQNGKTPKEYAIILQESYYTNVNEWKNKCHDLKSQVLDLQQKIDSVQLKTKLDEVCSDFNMSNYFTRLPASNDTNISNIQIENKLKENIEFVRGFILLDSFTTAEHLSDSEKDNISPKIIRTVSLMLAYLKDEDSLNLELHIPQQAIKEIHNLFDTYCGKEVEEIVKLCLNFVDDLLIDIHKTLVTNKVEEQHRRSILIQMIAEIPKLTILVLCRLLREITVLSDRLSNIFSEQNENYLPLLQTENIYYVLQSSEGVLHALQRQNSSLTFLKIPRTMLEEWEITTKKSLSVLGVHFPMFSIYIWNIKTLMKAILVDTFSLQ